MNISLVILLYCSAVVSNEDLFTTVLALEDNNIEGMTAVAEVVWNRAEHNPEKVHRVLLKKYQFSCINAHTVYDKPLVQIVRRARSRSNWQDAQKIAQETLAGKVKGIVGRANHYHAYRGKYRVTPYWTHPSLGGKNPDCTIVKHVGDHVFLTLE